MRGFIKKMIIAFAIIMTVYVTYENYEMKNVQEGIAKKIIRFHVRANSDKKEDQLLKLKVKDAVIDYLKDNMEDVSDLAGTCEFLEAHHDEIICLAENVIKENGYDYSVTAYFDKSYFPLKTYGDMSFPPGYYNAFRIDIGNAKGQNWWCVLYPRLCFVDSTYAYVPDESKEEFKTLLTGREYDAVTVDTVCDGKVKFDFRILHILED